MQLANSHRLQFSALILKGFGFTTMHTLLLGMALSAIVLAAVLISYVSQHEEWEKRLNIRYPSFRGTSRFE
jgi:hypothetical protein